MNTKLTPPPFKARFEAEQAKAVRTALADASRAKEREVEALKEQARMCMMSFSLISIT